MMAGRGTIACRSNVTTAAAMRILYGEVSATRTPFTRSRKPPQPATIAATRINSRHRRSRNWAHRGGANGTSDAGEETGTRGSAAPEYSIARAVLDRDAPEQQRAEHEEGDRP